MGIRRLLALFAKYDIKTTFFVPGHSLETFPEECALIRDAGHEFGLHGYSHENPRSMTPEQQRAVLDKSYRLLTEFCGKVSVRSRCLRAEPAANVTAATRIGRAVVGDAKRGGGADAGIR